MHYESKTVKIYSVTDLTNLLHPEHARLFWNGLTAHRDLPRPGSFHSVLLHGYVVRQELHASGMHYADGAADVYHYNLPHDLDEPGVFVEILVT
jgi:hypothetical protein